MPRLRDSGKPDPAIRAASAVLAGPAFFPGKRSNQPHFGRRSNGIPLAIAIMHAWMKRRLRRVLERRHTLYPPVSRLLLSDYRLLNVYGVMWPRRPGFFSGKGTASSYHQIRNQIAASQPLGRMDSFAWFKPDALTSGEQLVIFDYRLFSSPERLLI
ncbi:hypothetical protein BDZ89DRAFT_1151000 [Hymenopellis radicata]|nr:hypothetical protein BDZ89DRAFT_1151000 [Hymenopellis radicata]